MPKTFSGRELSKILASRYGFEEVGISGSHLKMRKVGKNQNLTVIIPLHSEVFIGTFLSILRQAKVSKEDFLKKSKK